MTATIVVQPRHSASGSNAPIPKNLEHVE